MKMFVDFLRDDSGQGTSEYAIILGLIVVATIALMVAFREQLTALWTNITAGFKTAVDASALSS